MPCGTTTRTASASCTGPRRWAIARSRHRPLRSCRVAVDPLRQLHVQFGESAAVVGGQGYLDAVVHVAPFRMMVELLCRQRHTRHEAPGFAETLELESSF